MQCPENRSVLITGGAGHLGSIMVGSSWRGFRVSVLDNFMFKQNSLHIIAHPAFDVINGDARNEKLLKDLVVNKDIVIPLAALVGAPLCEKDPVGANSINLDAQTMLLDLLSPGQWVLMPITNSGYGIGGTDTFCTEESPLRPISIYGRQKVMIEERLLERDNAISFRLATVFGMAPRMCIDLLVNDFVYRAVYDRTVVVFENFRRNYIHVRDVTRAFLHGSTILTR